MGCNSPRVGHCETSTEGKSDTLRTACSSCRHRVAVIVVTAAFVPCGCRRGFCFHLSFFFVAAVWTWPPHPPGQTLCMLYPPTAPRRLFPPAAAAQYFFVRSRCTAGAAAAALLPFFLFGLHCKLKSSHTNVIHIKRFLESDIFLKEMIPASQSSKHYHIF